MDGSEAMATMPGTHDPEELKQIVKLIVLIRHHIFSLELFNVNPAVGAGKPERAAVSSSLKRTFRGRGSSMEAKSMIELLKSLSRFMKRVHAVAVQVGTEVMYEWSDQLFSGNAGFEAVWRLVESSAYVAARNTFLIPRGAEQLVKLFKQRIDSLCGKPLPSGRQRRILAERLRQLKGHELSISGIGSISSKVRLMKQQLSTNGLEVTSGEALLSAFMAGFLIGSMDGLLQLYIKEMLPSSIVVRRKTVLTYWGMCNMICINGAQDRAICDARLLTVKYVDREVSCDLFEYYIVVYDEMLLANEAGLIVKMTSELRYNADKVFQYVKVSDVGPLRRFVGKCSTVPMLYHMEPPKDAREIRLNLHGLEELGVLMGMEGTEDTLDEYSGFLSGHNLASYPNIDHRARQMLSLLWDKYSNIANGVMRGWQGRTMTREFIQSRAPIQTVAKALAVSRLADAATDGCRVYRSNDDTMGSMVWRYKAEGNSIGLVLCTTVGSRRPKEVQSLWSAVSELGCSLSDAIHVCRGMSIVIRRMQAAGYKVFTQTELILPGIIEGLDRITDSDFPEKGHTRGNGQDAHSNDESRSDEQTSPTVCAS